MNEVIKKKYYSITEIAELVSLSPSAIRHILKVFSLRVAKNSRGNYRFESDAVKKLMYIKYLIQDEGFTYRGALKKYRQRYKM